MFLKYELCSRPPGEFPFTHGQARGTLPFGLLEVDAGRIRIRVQLVNTESSEQTWAEEFDGKMTSDNVLAFRDEIVGKVVAMIGSDYGIVHRAAAKLSRGKRIVSMNALEATMLFDDFQLHISPSTFDRARRALEHAVDIDPEYAVAWAALAVLCLDAWVLGFGGIGRPVQLGLEYARRAYRLDPTLQHAAAARAYACSVDGDRDGVIHAARRVVTLNPNEPAMVGWAGFFLAGAGEYDEGVALVARARELNPHAPDWWHATDFFRSFGTGDYGEALKSAYAVESDDFYWGPLVRAAALGKLGREAEASAELNRMLSIRPGFSEDPTRNISGLVSSKELAEEILDGLYMAGLSKR